MLVLTRKLNEKIIIDGCIEVTVAGIEGNRVRLGISAPPEVRIDREEVSRRIQQWQGTEAEAVGAGI